MSDWAGSTLESSQDGEKGGMGGPVPDGAVPEVCTALTKRSSDLSEMIVKLCAKRPVSLSDVLWLASALRPVLLREANCVSVAAPATVVGDVHGQLDDLLALLALAGAPGETRYVFLGDYVDRGYYGVEVFLLLACFKLRHPGAVTLLRGNHETRNITRVYGFYDECLRKYGGERAWLAITDLFECLPVCAMVDGRFFCDHGGLSAQALGVDDIQALTRAAEPVSGTALSDLLWSDPGAGPEWAPSPRGAGALWGQTATDRFLRLNACARVARAHQLVDDGFQWTHQDKVATIFSAPNYCYRCGNLACIMQVSEADSQLLTFAAAAYRPPNELTSCLSSWQLRG